MALVLAITGLLTNCEALTTNIAPRMKADANRQYEAICVRVMIKLLDSRSSVIVISAVLACLGISDNVAIPVDYKFITGAVQSHNDTVVDISDVDCIVIGSAVCRRSEHYVVTCSSFGDLSTGLGLWEKVEK